jgi:hypothetical protein
MAYFAELNQNNTVLRVVAINNEVLLDEQGNEVEQKGIDYCKLLFGGTWLQTSYNSFGNQHKEGKKPLRKNYAGMGFTYDPKLDAFIQPKPDGNFELNQETCLWENLELPENDIGVSRV